MAITISELKPANEVGTCNACARQTNENGTDPRAMVYEVLLIKSRSGGLLFRLCLACKTEMEQRLAEAD